MRRSLRPHVHDMRLTRDGEGRVVSPSHYTAGMSILERHPASTDKILFYVDNKPGDGHEDTVILEVKEKNMTAEVVGRFTMTSDELAILDTEGGPEKLLSMVRELPRA